MKNKLIFFILTSFLCGCAHQPEPKLAKPESVRVVACPAQDMRSSGITRIKPTSAEELVRQSVSPPAVIGANKEWSLNSLATANQNLFLSCYYSSKKIITFKLPLQNEFCMAKDSDKKLYVECLKK